MKKKTRKWKRYYNLNKQPGKLEGWEEKMRNYAGRTLKRTVKMLLFYILLAHFKVIGESLLGKCSK